MCGLYVAVRQKAHIVAEGRKSGMNLLMLCPSCHIMFDTHIKPKIHKSLKGHVVNNMPASWGMSIYEQAAKASVRKQKKPSD